MADFAESTSVLPEGMEAHFLQFVQLDKLLRSAIYKRLGMPIARSKLGCEIQSREQKHEAEYGGKSLRGRQLLWVVAWFFSVTGETQFCLDQVASSKVKCRVTTMPICS